MGKPAARITDMHVCPMVTGIVPHVGGPIALGMFTVLTGMLPQARVTDLGVCVGPPDMIAMGSTGVLVGGLPAARMGDLTVHGGTIVMGMFTVLIGETMAGSVGAADQSVVSMVEAGLGAAGMSDGVAQAKALIGAHQKGVAFCARCAAT